MVAGNEMVAELGQRSARRRVAAVAGQGDVDLRDCPVGIDVRRDRLLEQRARGGLLAEIGDRAATCGEVTLAALTATTAGIGPPGKTFWTLL